MIPGVLFIAHRADFGHCVKVWQVLVGFLCCDSGEQAPALNLGNDGEQFGRSGAQAFVVLSDRRDEGVIGVLSGIHVPDCSDIERLFAIA